MAVNYGFFLAGDRQPLRNQQGRSSSRDFARKAREAERREDPGACALGTRDGKTQAYPWEVQIRSVEALQAILEALQNGHINQARRIAKGALETIGLIQ